MNNKIVVAGIVIIIIAVLAGVVALSRPAQAETIKIGALIPLTGELLIPGTNAQKGVIMAVDEINAQGGINGKKLEVIYEDGRCNAKDAAEAGNRLINVEKVQFIIGGICSGETLAVAPVAEQNKVVMLSPCSSAPKVSEAGDYIFRDYPSDTFQGSFAAEHAYNIGVRKAAILNTIGAWGEGLRDKFKQRFLELGGQIVAEESFEQSATDMRGQLTKIKSANPDLIYMPAYTQGSSLILKQAKELGITAKKLSGDGSDDPAIIETAGEAAEGFQITVVIPGTDDFVNRFTAKFGTGPLACTSYAYDAAQIGAQLLKKVGNSGEAIKNELYKVKDFNGASGTISFDSNGDRIKSDFAIKEVRNGKFEVITTNQQKININLGATLPLTGDVSAFGEAGINALALAAEEINANGDINLEIVYEDDQCDGKESVTTVTKLINIDNVAAIIGPFCSAAVLPAAPIAEQGKVVIFSGSATNPKITQAGDYIFRNVPSDAFQGKFAAEFIYSTLGKKKVAVGYANEEYGAGLKDVFIARFKELGGTILAAEANERGATDMRTQLTKMKQANPEAIYYSGLPQDVGYFLKNARELGINTTTISAEAADDKQMITIAGEAANGLIYTVPRQFADQQFIAAYKARFGKEPLLYANNYYDATYLLTNAAKICNSDPTCIKNELYKVKDYPGASGTITIDSNGDLATAEYQLKIVVNGTSTDYST